MDLQCHACIGGGNVKEDFRKLEQGQHVVVGTPGRVLDMINRRALSEEEGGRGGLSVKKGGEGGWFEHNPPSLRKGGIYSVALGSCLWTIAMQLVCCEVNSAATCRCVGGWQWLCR